MAARPLHGRALDAGYGPARRYARSLAPNDTIRPASGRTQGPCPPGLHGECAHQLWVADFTYVAPWRGFVYVAFVVDVFARRIVGWRASSSPNTSLVLDALEQAIHDRRPTQGLIQHTDRGVQYLSIRYSERLADIGITPSVGRVGSAYELKHCFNALAETVIGLFKTEVIRRRGPWRDLEAVEFATLDWIDWFNHQRLLGPIGDIPPAEAEANFHDTRTESAQAA